MASARRPDCVRCNETDTVALGLRIFRPSPSDVPSRNEIWSVERASIISIIQDGIAARERIRLQRLPQRDILHLLDEFGHRAAICIAFAQYAQCAPHDIPVRGQRLESL